MVKKITMEGLRMVLYSLPNDSAPHGVATMTNNLQSAAYSRQPRASPATRWMIAR